MQGLEMLMRRLGARWGAWLDRNAGILLVVGTALLMLGLNLLTPTWGDDWHRSFPLDRAGQIPAQLLGEYLGWTGRMSVLALTYLFLLQYPGSLVVFAIINALAFSALLVGLFVLATGRWPRRSFDDAAMLLLLLGAAWFGIEAFGEGVLWKTGAIGFLWVSAATLFAVRPYVDLLCDRASPPEPGKGRWIALPGYFLLGMALENLSAATLVVMLAALFECWRMRRPVAGPMAWNCAAYACGFAVLVAAPGNFVRYAMQSDGQPMYARLPALVERIWLQETETTGLLFAILVVLVLSVRPGERAMDLRRFSAIFGLALLSGLAMIGSTAVAYGGRTAFASEVLLIASLGAAARPLLDQSRTGWPLIGALLVVGTVLAADMLRTVEQYAATQAQTGRRETLMREYRAAGIRVARLPSYRVPYIDGLHDDLVRRRYFLRDIHGDIPNNGWRNGTFAEDHGFDFALRIDKPFVLFEPTIDDRAHFRQYLNGEQLRIVARDERETFASREVVYLIAPGSCAAARSAAAAAGYGFDWQEGQVALVRADGMVDNRHCVLRADADAVGHDRQPP